MDAMEDKIASIYSLVGEMDIYLLDQVLKGQFQKNMKVLDAGCGDGRNSLFFIKTGFEVYGVDLHEASIQSFKDQIFNVSPDYDMQRIEVGGIESLDFIDRQFDVIICSAVLHFANDEAHFENMLNEMWRVLKYGGFLFCRLASDIGIEKFVEPLGNRRFNLPDGSQRFLVNQEMLLNYTDKLNGILMEPIKTVNVQNTRCMTNWIISKVI